MFRHHAYPPSEREHVSHDLLDGSLEELAIQGHWDRESCLFRVGTKLVQQSLKVVDELVLAAFLVVFFDRCGECGTPVFFKRGRGAVELYGQVERQRKPSLSGDLDLGLPGLSKLLEALNGGLFDVGR